MPKPKVIYTAAITVELTEKQAREFRRNLRASGAAQMEAMGAANMLQSVALAVNRALRKKTARG